MGGSGRIVQRRRSSGLPIALRTKSNSLPHGLSSCVICFPPTSLAPSLSSPFLHSAPGLQGGALFNTASTFASRPSDLLLPLPSLNSNSVERDALNVDRRAELLKAHVDLLPERRATWLRPSRTELSAFGTLPTPRLTKPLSSLSLTAAPRLAVPLHPTVSLLLKKLPLVYPPTTSCGMLKH